MLSWNESIKKGIVRKAESNTGLIISLIAVAEKRIKVISSLPINQETASTVFTNNYDSLREICEAVAILKGYKIYSHEAIGLFLRDILKEEALHIKFDKFRIMRNGVNYYGETPKYEEAVLAIQEIKIMISIIKEKYLTNKK